MTDHFQAVKSRIDIVSEIEKRTGFSIKKVGKNIDLAECPFCKGHDCFRIDPNEQAFNCFQCDAGGSIIDFVVKEKSCSSQEALQYLAVANGYELTDESSNNSVAISKHPHEKIFEAATELYYKALYRNQQALNYQKKTRRHSDKTLKTFRVGYADGKLFHALREQGFTEDQILASGFAKKRDVQAQDFFIKGLYIYPHLNPSGQVCHFSAKDPRKKYNYQLPNEYRGPGCLFFNIQAFKGKEILLVEGENDLLSVYGRGNFGNVAAICGQISDDQIVFLKNWIKQSSGKTIYLCFDNDQAGEKYQQRIKEALNEYCLPDKLLSINKRLLKQEQQKLKEDHGEDEIEIEPPLISKAQSVKLRVIKYDQGCNDIDEYLKKENEPERAFKGLIEGASQYLMPLKKMLAIQRDWHSKLNSQLSSNQIGELIFDYSRIVGKFFIDGEKVFLFYEPRIYEIGNNVPFKSMLYTVAGLNYAYSSTKQVIEVLLANAYRFGEYTSVPGWIHTDRDKNIIFFNLCNEKNEIVKISPGSIEIIQNGVNSDQILLRNSPKMQPLYYIPDVDIQKAMVILKETIFDNLACSRSNRYFILARLLNTLLIQFTKARGLDKYSGSKGSAKTSAASWITVLTYGKDCVTVGSAASDFSEATVSPLTIADNLESYNLNNDKRDFLIVSATGVTRQKRKGGTDSENVYELSCTQVVVTSIEPFVEPELIERTCDIIFDKKYFNEDYLEATGVETKIITNRDLIWSAFFQIIAYHVLPRFNEKRVKALKMLKNDYSGHSKSRLNELYSCLYILCKEILKYIPHPGYIKDPYKKERMAEAVLEDWIVYQDKIAKATERGSNPILYRLEVLLKEYLANLTGFTNIYRFEADHSTNHLGEVTSVTFTASTQELYFAFETLAKEKGVSCPFKSTSQLGARIKDAIDILGFEGWEFVRYKKTVSGTRYHCITKTFNRHDEYA
jgi:DNA primase